MSGRSYPRFLFIAVAALLAATIAGPIPAGAASQNELLVSIDFDGQSFTGDDPLDPGTGLAADHTPGQDERGDNGVVRTLDLVGYRLDYNVNEEGQTGATLNLQLPPNMTWITADSTVDATFPEGMFPGCRPGSTITSSGTVYGFAAPIDATVTGTNDILTCIVDDEDHEGNNGTIFVTAQLLLDIDDQVKTLTASLDTNEQPCSGAAVCSGTVDVISSGSPEANLQKGDPVEDVDGNEIGYEANEWFPMQRNGVDGWVSIWYINFNSLAGGLGGAPVNDGVTLSFYDHFWDFTPGTVLATDTGDLTGTSIVPGRAACGALDTSVPPASAGTWTCTDVSSTTVQLELSGYDTDGSASPHSTAQIAIWSPLTELENKVPQRLINTISQSATPPSAINTASPIEFGAVAGDPPAPTLLPESTVVDNDAVFSYGLTTGGSGGSRDHNVFFLDGPYQMREHMRDDGIARGVDFRRVIRGGLAGIKPGDFLWLGDQQVPRSKIVTLTSQHTTAANLTAPIHSCVHFDNTHANLVALPATFPVFDTGTGQGINNSSVGGYTDSPSHGLANVIVSERARFIGNFAGNPLIGIDQLPDSYAVVEFATSVAPIRQIDTPTTVATPAAIVEDGITCNNDDAVGGTWINSNDAAALATAFDPDGDGRYQGIDRMRIRMVDESYWDFAGVSNRGLTLEASVQLQVLDDVAVDVAGSEIFSYASRGAGEWDPTIDNMPPETRCHSIEFNSDQVTSTGWCNNRYTEDTNVGFGVPGGAVFYDNSASERFRDGIPMMAHLDKLTIVEADIDINKVNLDGLTDIADNGDSVFFGIEVSTIGASVDTLEDITLTDALPSRYQFVAIAQPPTTPGASCTGGQTITCTFGDQPGGWSDYVEIEVAVVNSAAGVQTVNTARLDAIRPNPSGPPVALSEESFAFSRSGTPFDEAAIVKAVNSIEGACDLHPSEDPPPADWADRCELTDFATGQLLFDLTLTNEGNVVQQNVRFVDVFPHLADEAEPASATGVVGDARSPESDFAGNVGYVSFTGDVQSVWVTADDPSTVSRDPDNAITDTVWCDGATQVGGPAGGVCPVAAADVTAIYAVMNDVPVGGSVTGQLELANTGHECDDIWTNSFGARHDGTLLPIRSNDVSIMVNCEFDLALAKTVDPAFVPGADWITAGTSTVDFLVEIVNQGDDIENFDVTDYVDTASFSFDVANNPAGSTTGSATLPYTWDATDPAAPVVSVVGQLANGESVFIPVTLTIEDPGGTLENWAEISYFDNDGDPTNGDSDPTNPANPSTGPLLDDDSTPDDTQANDAQPIGAGQPGDGEVDGDGSGSDPVDGDEDDHDVAGIPIYDLELIKTARAPGVDVSTAPWQVTFEVTVTNQGTRPVYWVDVTDYPPTGLTYNAAATSALWAAELITGVTDASPTFTIEGPIAPDAAVTIPMVFDVTDLSAAPYTNGAEISAFDADADPANAPNPLAVDTDSTPDAVNDDDLIDHSAPGYDPDGDGDLNEPTPGDEDDHDVAVVGLPFDLALQKRVDPTDPELLDGIQAGDDITFFVTVTNQAAPIEDFDVIDYVSASWTFDPTKNAAGTTTGDQSLPFTWDTTDPTQPIALVDGALGTLETVTIPIVLTVNLGAGGDLLNVAEILRFDDDGDPTNGDSDPANPNNPAGGPLVDVDSTPDGDNSDPISDDVIDENATTGDISGDGVIDEDDHDPASVKWWDLELVKERAAGQSYVIDPASVPLEVSFDITVNNQGQEEALNVTVLDSPPTGLTFSSLADDAGGAVVNSGANEFTIASLAGGASVTFTVVYSIDLATLESPTVNAAEISSMEGLIDPDGPLGPLPLGVYPVADVDSNPDNDPTNDDVSSDGTVDPADSHNTLDNDPDGDGNLHESEAGDEDDHDTEAISIPFDLALTKTLDSMTTPLIPDGSVTMLITVTNQAAAVEQIDVTDYLDPAIWAPFDPALNPGGAVDASSTAVDGFSFSWDATDPANPVATVTADPAGGKLAPGETVVIPITAQLAAGFDPATTDIVNVAEISRFDDDADPTNGDSDPANPGNPPSGPLSDIDSTPDGVSESTAGETIGGDLVDDALDGDGSPGSDEDDHDPVIIPVLDLALRKSVSPATEFPISHGDEVTFDIEVINQGNVDVTDPAVVDYADPAMWLAFDAAINPTGTSTGDAALAYSWATAANGQDGDLAVTGTLAAGETITIPVTLVIAADADLEALSNTAEITGGAATVDDDGDPLTPPVPVTNPDGSPVVDIDSTPDATNDDPLVDDVVDGTGGDEDDHDVALVQPPTYNLGNQIWNDVDNDGMLDPGEDPIAGVVVHLFEDADGDGQPDDVNGDGVIDADDAVASTTTGPDGEYLFTDLPTGDYIVGIAPENWDDGGALDGYVSSDPTSSDANDNVDNNDDGTPCQCADGYVFSTPVTLDDLEPTDEPGLNNDPNHPDGLSNLTIDFGFWQPQFDLALRKSLSAGTPAVVDVGDTVTFTIEVINQGSVTAVDFTVVDYLPAGMTLADSDWTANTDGTAQITLPGPLPGGQTATIDITVTVNSVGDLENEAEIAGAVAVDQNGDSFLLPNGDPLGDIDSEMDAVNSDTIIDNQIDRTSASGDEDDHDIARLTVRSATPTPLAFTGSSTQEPLAAAILAIAFGALLLVWSRRRRLV